MVVGGYSTKQVREISGPGATAVARWKKQYQPELKGQTPRVKEPLHRINNESRNMKRNSDEPNGIMKY